MDMACIHVSTPNINTGISNSGNAGSVDILHAYMSCIESNVMWGHMEIITRFRTEK